MIEFDEEVTIDNEYVEVLEESLSDRINKAIPVILMMAGILTLSVVIIGLVAYFGTGIVMSIANRDISIIVNFIVQFFFILLIGTTFGSVSFLVLGVILFGIAKLTYHFCKYISENYL